MSARRPVFRTQFQTHDGQGSYGRIVGTVVDVITTNFGNPHARLVVNVNGDRYEVDINVYSTMASPQYPNGSDVQSCIRDEAIANVPAQTVDHTSTLSYVSLDLKQSDFASLDVSPLHDKLVSLAQASDLVEIFGVMYSDPGGPQGIHDIHMNSGENGSAANAESKDGAIAFYSIPKAGENFNAHAQWVFIKFATQTLP